MNGARVLMETATVSLAHCSVTKRCNCGVETRLQTLQCDCSLLLHVNSYYRLSTLPHTLTFPCIYAIYTVYTP